MSALAFVSLTNHMKATALGEIMQNNDQYAVQARSLKVTTFGTNRKTMCHFLLNLLNLVNNAYLFTYLLPLDTVPSCALRPLPILIRIYFPWNIVFWLCL